MNAQQQLDRAMQAAHAGDYVSAINGLSKLIERMPEEGVVYQALGIVLLEADKPEDAALVLRKASELLGENAEVLQFLGVALAQSGQAAEAVSTLENAIEILGNRASSNVFLNLGNANFALDQVEAAATAFREATRRDAQSDQAWGNLGLSLKGLGKCHQAVKAFRKAVQLCPTASEYRLNLANTLSELGNNDEAEMLLQGLCQSADHSALSHAALGQVLFGRGRYDEAKRSFQRACEMDPENSKFHLNYGALLAMTGHVSEPLHHFRRAIKLKPDNWRAWVDMGNLLGELGKTNEARRCFELVVERVPEHQDALAGLAGILNRAGEHEEVLRLLRPVSRSARGLSVNFVVAYCAASIGMGRAGQCLPLLKKTMKKPHHKPEQSLLLHTYGRVMDKLKRYDEAFDAYSQSNALRCLEFNPEQHRRGVDATIASVTRETLAQIEKIGSESDQPIFIVGMPRSGTSLVEQILCSHSEVFGAGELEFVRMTSDQLLEQGNGSLLQGLQNCSQSALERLAEAHLEEVRASAGELTRFTDKMPANFQHLALIQKLFPNARIVHCKRARLDTCVSCFRQNFGAAYGFTTRLDWLGVVYEQYERLMAHWKAELDLPIYEIEYESLVANSEGEIPPLLEFCGLEFEESCLSPHKNQRVVYTASHAQVRQPIYKSSVGYAERYRRHLGPLLGRKDAA